MNSGTSVSPGAAVGALRCRGCYRVSPGWSPPSAQPQLIGIQVWDFPLFRVKCVPTHGIGAQLAARGASALYFCSINNPVAIPGGSPLPKGGMLRVWGLGPTLQGSGTCLGKRDCCCWSSPSAAPWGKGRARVWAKRVLVPGVCFNKAPNSSRLPVALKSPGCERCSFPGQLPGCSFAGARLRSVKFTACEQSL